MLLVGVTYPQEILLHRGWLEEEVFTLTFFFEIFQGKPYKQAITFLLCAISHKYHWLYFNFLVVYFTCFSFWTLNTTLVTLWLFSLKCSDNQVRGKLLRS